MGKTWLVCGALGMALAVMLGAFGAHGLRARLPADLLAIFHTGVQYHLYHALGLLAIGLIALRFPDLAGIRWAGGLMVAGTVIFSGSLYVLALSGVRIWGAVTPVGGVALIAAWLILAWSLWRGIP